MLKQEIRHFCRVLSTVSRAQSSAIYGSCFDFLLQDSVQTLRSSLPKNLYAGSKARQSWLLPGSALTSEVTLRQSTETFQAKREVRSSKSH